LIDYYVFLPYNTLMNQNSILKQIILPVVLLGVAVVLAVGFISALRALTEPASVATPSPLTPPTVEVTDQFDSKIAGTNVSIAYDNKSQESPDVLVVLFRDNLDKLFRKITVQDIETQFTMYGYLAESEHIESSSQMRIPTIMYSEKFNYFIIPIEYAPYRSGSGNEFWRMFIYDVEQNKFDLAQSLYENIDERYNIGSYTPERMKLSPSGDNLLYLTGATGGICAKAEYPEVINLATLTFLEVQSSELENTLDGYNKQGLSYELYIQDFYWKNDKVIGVDYQIILCISPNVSENRETLPIREFEFKIP